MADNKIIFTGKSTGLSNYRFVMEPAENNGKTIFSLSDTVRLKLYPGGTSPELSVTAGSSELHLSDIMETHTEFLVYRDSDTARTTYHINRLISAVWEGRGEGIPKIYGSRLILPRDTTGVLKVTYETSYDLINVSCKLPTYLLITAKSASLEGDLLIDFTNGYRTEIYSKEVVMTVRDSCTKETVSDAAVYLNGKFSGKTDSKGIVRLGSLKRGTYGLKITKDGYTDTDKDSIRNDFFEVL